jgi:putative membrane protein
MIDYGALPTLNATLNGVAAVLLSAGYVAIRSGRIPVHRACMLGAFTASTLFLASYVTYHLHSPVHAFQGHGPVRGLYFAILVSHIVLAATVVPLALLTLSRALRGRFERHRAIARWTLPVWLYVSVTGVLVYLMLYVWFPQG